MRRVFLALVCVVLCSPVSGNAATLKAVAKVAISETEITQSDNTRTISFTVTNNAEQPIQGAFGVRVQATDGTTTYTGTDGTVTLLGAHSEHSSVPFVVPSVAGTYHIFASFTSSAGVPLALSAVGDVIITTSSAQSVTTQPLISSTPCVYDEGSFVCTTQETPTTQIEYTLFAGGAGGEIAYTHMQSVVPHIDTTITLDSAELPSGRYMAQFVFKDTRGTVLGTQELFFTRSTGSWMSIDIVSIDSTDTAFSARAFLSGEHADESWGLWYWILDANDNLCAHEKQSFANTLPREYLIQEALTNCPGAHLAVALHLGTNQDGSLIIADTYGDADIPALIAQTAHIPAISQSINTTFAYGLRILIAFAALVVLGIVLVVGRARLFIVAVSIIFFAQVPVVFADTFVSGNETFTVTLEKTTYQNNETVDFTFSIIDSTTGQKPVGDSVQVRVDSGSYTTIVTSSNTSTLYSVSLPAVATGGAHSLNFLAPGHFFGAALFGASRFGIDNRSFSVPFTVVANSAPPQPTITGSCVVGQTNTYYIRATDPDNDPVFYDYYFNSESSQRVPTTGTVASGTQVSVTHPRTTRGSEVLNARATDSNNNASSWKGQTIACVDSCTHCVYDGGSPVNTFTAFPTLVKEGETATLSWHLENVTNCSITSNHPNGDAWDWDTVRTVTTVTTSPITQRTMYTMRCDRVDGTPVSPSAKVRVDLVPKFQEF